MEIRILSSSRKFKLEIKAYNQIIKTKKDQLRRGLKKPSDII